MRRLATCVCLLAGSVIVAVVSHARAEVVVQFDFSRDTNNFFGPSTAARATLEAAGDVFEGILLDDLEAITPSDPPDRWRAVFSDPSTGVVVNPLNPIIPANTVVVFVGARDLGGSTLGHGGPGGVLTLANASPAWNATVRSRGEGTTEGPGADDFGPWGGAIAVNQGANWNLDHTVAPSSGENDLFSVILHELEHVLGVGTADSWSNLVNGSDFTGLTSVAEHGGNVPVNTDLSHWAHGTFSEVFPDGLPQEALMVPRLPVGSRRLLTDLDVTALDDLGWEIVPEPSTLALAVVGLIGLFMCGTVTHFFGSGTCSKRPPTALGG